MERQGMDDVRVYIATDGGVHFAAYLAALIAGNAGAYPPGMPCLREPGQIGICNQSADHLYTVSLAFCQNAFSLGRSHDAPGSENGNVDGGFDGARQVSRIAWGDMHGGLEREHVGTENTAHCHRYIVDASRGLEQVGYFQALLRRQTCPGGEFICAEAHTQDTAGSDSSMYRFQRLLDKT